MVEALGQVATLDRGAIRSMVEDGMRGLMAINPADTAALTAAVQRWDQHILSVAAVMPEGQRDPFIRAAAEERQILIDEQRRDPAGLRRRLGVQQPSDIGRQTEGIGSMAAKTAVRASIWAAIWAIFFGR